MILLGSWERKCPDEEKRGLVDVRTDSFSGPVGQRWSSYSFLRLSPATNEAGMEGICIYVGRFAKVRLPLSTGEKDEGEGDHHFFSSLSCTILHLGGKKYFFLTCTMYIIQAARSQHKDGPLPVVSKGPVPRTGGRQSRM